MTTEGLGEARSIPGFSRYRVTSDGRVLSAARKRPTELSLSSRAGKTRAYKVVGMVDDSGKRRFLLVHRLVLTVFRGPPPTPRHEAAHLNGDGGDNRIENLEWTTHRENEAQKEAHGTVMRGTRNGRAQLTPDGVREIRRLLAEGWSEHRVARHVHVGRECVRHVKKQETWRHVA